MSSPNLSLQRRQPVKVGDLAPDFSLADVSGKIFTLSDVRARGKVLLIFNLGVT